jgi:F420H(2)-dependent quinone reductase
MSQSSPPSKLPPRWFIPLAWAVHRTLDRLTGGRFGLRPPSPKTDGLGRIHTMGRRSGAERLAMVGYWEDGPNLYTLAMNGWGAPEPAWWLNLQAHPEASIELPDGPRAIRARAATGEERARLWGQMPEQEPNLDGWAARRPEQTAVVVFEPRSGAAVANGGPGTERTG